MGKLQNWKAELFCKTDFELGEGACWHNGWQQFLFLDIKGKKLGRVNADGSGLVVKNLPKMPGVVRPTVSNDLIIAWQGALVSLDFETLSYKTLKQIELDLPNNRSNDGACDAQGRFWFGTMDCQAKLNAGNFYCFDGQLVKKIANTSVSNGICWSLDHQTFYYIDSFDFDIKAFDFEPSTATITNKRTVIVMASRDWVPDGMCIDSEGMLWVAIWGGGRVNRYNPNNGECIGTVAVAAPNVTSVAFGGAELKTLLVTTAKDGLSPADLQAFPNSGNLFSVDVEIKGLQPAVFNK